MQPIETLLHRLDKVREMDAPGKWMSRCPTHDDNNPSLSISLRGESIAIYCHAGCSTEDVLESVGLTFRDLYGKDDACYQRSIANRGSKSTRHLNDYDIDLMVLRLAKSDLEAGRALSVEDQARVALAKERLKESA
ncbi:MAG: hypothetical protein KZQ84_08320 [Candidatus Thiodiazotropha sp. (ex Lucinoma borealis)]|nr:hypothetical protein [Candidatus Thiodiazotropha sp. (ex Lucinoma borealis)]